jgi:hypothetical protein
MERSSSIVWADTSDPASASTPEADAPFPRIEDLLMEIVVPNATPSALVPSAPDPPSAKDLFPMRFESVMVSGVEFPKTAP